MHAHDLVTAAAEGRVPLVVIVVGDERFFIDRAVAAVRRAVVDEATAGFNEEIFQGAKSLSAGSVIDAARTLPMLARQRFVLVRGIDAMHSDELARLLPYLEDPAPSACLVLTASKLDGRSRFAQRAKKLGYLADAAPLKPRELRTFLAREAERRRVRLSPDAAAALADAIGTDLPALDDALERLSLYVGGSATIDLAAVEACVVKVRIETVWSLVDAVGAGDRKTALKAVASLLSDREPPLRILSLLARQLRMIGRAHSALARGASPTEAASVAGAPPFKARELSASARRFRPARLRRAFAIIASTDLALKGSQRPPERVLESAILELTA
ncbi:MAG: DNA polymerase III subunit delta [Myxococcales bacterium]|nr:DNA polymerase III subunit delta [Myxococcales bacterium]